MAWLSSEFYNYPASPPCRAVHMTLKALKIEYEDKPVDLLKAENKRPWFIRLNPQHTVPTFTDQGYCIWESRAIMQYLCNKYCTDENRHLYPTNPEERGNVDRLLFFDMGTLNYAINEYFKPKLFNGMLPEKEKENHLKQSLDYLDGYLEKAETPFLCGENYTIADISILASITQLEALDYSYKCYGEVMRYVERLKKAIPFYAECCDAGIKMAKDNIKQLEDDYKKQIEKERKASLPKK